jgi:hypothetical protein
LVDYLFSLLDNFDEDSEDVGVEPYNIPRNIMDPKCAFNFGLPDVHSDLSSRTGDLLLNPVCPKNAPNGHIFVNTDSKNWFEAQSKWPSGNIGSHLSAFSDIPQVEEAVAQWVRVIATRFAVSVD